MHDCLTTQPIKYRASYENTSHRLLCHASEVYAQDFRIRGKSSQSDAAAWGSPWCSRGLRRRDIHGLKVKEDFL